MIGFVALVLALVVGLDRLDRAHRAAMRARERAEERLAMARWSLAMAELEQSAERLRVACTAADAFRRLGLAAERAGRAMAAVRVERRAAPVRKLYRQGRVRL